MGQGLSRSIEPALLARQGVQNLSLPALLDALDPDRRDVDRHSVLESRAQESMAVRVGRAIPSSVLMDGKHALGAPSRAPDVEPLEALGRRVVHGQDEAEVDRVSQTPAIATEPVTDRFLVAPERTVSLTDPVELAPLSVGQPLLAVCDVADLPPQPIPGIAGFDEERAERLRDAVM